MKLNDFGRSVWRRYLVRGMIVPVISSCAVIYALAGLDYVARLGVAWRLALLVALGAVLAWRLLRLRHQRVPPTDEELYYLASVWGGHRALDKDPGDLELPEDRLAPYPLRTIALCVLLILVPLLFEPGRTAARRLVLLSGEWPKRTQITDVSIPDRVEEGLPITIGFTTHGQIPRVVRLSIDGEPRPLVGSGSERWTYDFIHAPGLVTVSLQAGDDTLSPRLVEILPSPVLVESLMTVTEPDYLGSEQQQVKGLVAQVPQGSDLLIRAKFREAQALRSSRGTHIPDEDGFIEFTLPAVTGDVSFWIDARPHQDLPWRTASTWKIQVVKDRAPTTQMIEPDRPVWLLKQSSLDLRILCRDDHGLKIFSLERDGESVLTRPLTGLEQTITARVSVADLGAQEGDMITLNASARDTAGVWGAAAEVRIHVVDPTTFRVRLLEQQQTLHRDLENLLSFMSRRVDRHTEDRLFDPAAEANSLRDDHSRTRHLAQSWKEYVNDLRVIEGLESSVIANERDRDWLDSDLTRLLEGLIANADDPQLARQKDAVERLESMSRRLSRSQDFHMALRILDEMISRQSRVVEELP